MKKKRKPPVGASWRIAAGAGERFCIYSRDYVSPHGPAPGATVLSKRAVFDELVIDRWFHLEQMDRRIWWLCIGEDMVCITIGRDGKPKMGEWYR